MSVSPRWVCLMYHDVSAGPLGVTGGSEYFSVSTEAFGRQLRSIEELGLRGRSIADVLASGSGPVVAISFDDGDLGQATRAFPALVARGMTATFFITTGWVGRPGYVSWAQLRDMHQAGMSIQSHTHSHPFLSELDAEALRDELRRSRALLNEELEQETSMIALPGGDAPRRHLRWLLAEEGYSVVATSRWGVNAPTGEDGVHYIRRCTVRGEGSAAAFVAIATGDRWVSMKKNARESAQAFIRASIGPTRYARWRRRALDAAGAPAAPRTPGRPDDREKRV